MLDRGWPKGELNGRRKLALHAPRPEVGLEGAVRSLPVNNDQRVTGARIARAKRC